MRGNTTWCGANLREGERFVALVVVGQVIPVLEISKDNIRHTVLEGTHPVEERLDTVGRAGYRGNAHKLDPR